jgi:hypothetical protein
MPQFTLEAGLEIDIYSRFFKLYFTSYLYEDGIIFSSSVFNIYSI